MSSLPDFLKTVNMFSTLAQRDLETLANMLRSEVYEDGARVINEGDSGDKFYIIRSGFVNVMRGPKGQEIFMTTLAPMDYFGEAALFSDMKRTAHIDANGKLELLVIDRFTFEIYLSSNTEAAAQILLFMLKKVFQRLAATSSELQFERKSTLEQSKVDQAFAAQSEAKEAKEDAEAQAATQEIINKLLSKPA